MSMNLFDPGAKTYVHLLDRLNRRLDLRYRDHSTAGNVALKSAPPLTEDHEQDALFEAPAVEEPPQEESLFSSDSVA